MKRFLLLTLFITALLQLVACDTPLPDGAGPISAIYLTADDGTLDTASLTSHPDVRVVDSFRALEDAILTRPMGSEPVAIWIDRNAVELVDTHWLRRPPQNGYPLVVVGIDDATYAFGELLAMPIEEGYRRGARVTLRPGFSMWTLESTGESGNRVVLHSYSAPPTVERLLEATRPYLQREA